MCFTHKKLNLSKLFKVFEFFTIDEETHYNNHDWILYVRLHLLIWQILLYKVTYNERIRLFPHM